MVWMISEGFGLGFFRDHSVLGWLALQFSHADWQGAYPWDMIQPFFMFIVGAAMPFAFEKRAAAGEAGGTAFLHVLKRCALLILLGTMARSIRADRPVLDLINVLAQIAFTYLVAYLVLNKGWKVQAGTALALLAAHTALFLLASAPGVMGPWDKNANIGWVLDTMILGKNWGGGYATINCVSSASATIAGVMAGFLLKEPIPAGAKIRTLLAWGGALVVAGLALHPVIPIIKKIWTASFAFYSIGYTLFALALSYWLFDVKGYRTGSRILAMVGANSIFIYIFHEILGRWMTRSGLVFTGWAVDLWGPFGNMLNAWLVIAFQVYVCYWLYQRRIFFKL